MVINGYFSTSSACHESGLTFLGMNLFMEAAGFSFVTKKTDNSVDSLFTRKGLMEG